MAAQNENVVSFGNLSNTERNTFTRQHALKKRPVLLQAGFPTQQSHQNLRAMKLQMRWQELKERELTAQKHNRQLLQQFEEAQDTLREMLTLNATMKTIRKEYERYLEENSPRWEQQFKEQTQAAQKRRMEDCLRSCLKNPGGSDRLLLSQGSTAKAQHITAPQSHNNQIHCPDYNQDGSPHLPYIPSSWLTHPQTQTARFPIRAPYHPQPSSHAPESIPPPPPFSPRPCPFPLPHLASTLAHRPPDWGSLLPHHLWSPTAGVAGHPLDSGALWGQLNMEEPPPERGDALVKGEGAGTSRPSSSVRGGSGGSRRSHVSQDLDIKPVRLPSGHAESSESSRESDQATRERRRKKRREQRERSQSSSSGREAPSSQGSSGISSAIIFAAATAAQSPESDASSKRSSSRRTRRSGALADVSPRPEMVMKEGNTGRANNSGSHKEESPSTESPIEESGSEKAGNLESGSQREDESGSVKIEEGSGHETEKEESGSSGRKSVAEKEEETERELDDGDGENDVEEKENSEKNEEHEERDEEENEASERKNTTEDEDGTGAEDEMQEQESVEEERNLKKGDNVERKQDSEEVDEDGSEGGEDEMEEDGESDEEEGGESGEEEEQRSDEAVEPEQEGESGEEEEQRSDEAVEPEQEGDSEDSIIALQDSRTKKIYSIPEGVEDEEEEEEEQGSTASDDDDDSNDFSEEGIENLLAPQDQSQEKEEKEKSAGQKPKANCDEVEMFQVEQCRSTKDNFSDSDEFDHFYD